MTWLLTFAGDAGGLPGDDARAAEQAVLDQAQTIADGLADAGHVGIKAEFTGTQLGYRNLLQPGDAGAAAPLVEQAPGTAADPTGPPAEALGSPTPAFGGPSDGGDLPEQTAEGDPASQGTA